MPAAKQILLDIGEGLSLMIGLPTIATWKNNSRPKNAKPGTFGFNTQTNNLEFFDGKDWYGGLMGKA